MRRSQEVVMIQDLVVMSQSDKASGHNAASSHVLQPDIQIFVIFFTSLLYNTQYEEHSHVLKS